MASLENLTQAALAEFVRDVIRTNHQFIGVPCEELIDLINAEPTFLDNAFGQKARIAAPPSADVVQLRKLAFGQQAMLTQGVHESAAGSNSHGRKMPILSLKRGVVCL
jgi:hypothetical protein